MNEILLSSILAYGAWALGAATLVGALGLPLPTTMLLLAAGAFMRQGTLNWQTAMALAALGAVLGDSASYLVGRYGGAATSRRMEKARAWRQAQGVFQRWGGLTIFFSRFLLTPLALPVNLIAGSTRYTVWRFLSLVVLGEILWVLLFSSLGYLFADQWSALSEVLGSATVMLLCLLALLVVGVCLTHRVYAHHLT